MTTQLELVQACTSLYNFPRSGPARPDLANCTTLYKLVQACTTLLTFPSGPKSVPNQITNFLPNRREVKFSLQLNFTLDHGGICRFLGLTAYHSVYNMDRSLSKSLFTASNA